MDTTMDSLFVMQVIDKQVFYVFLGALMDSLKDTIFASKLSCSASMRRGKKAPAPPMVQRLPLWSLRLTRFKIVEYP